MSTPDHGPDTTPVSSDEPAAATAPEQTTPEPAPEPAPERDSPPAAAAPATPAAPRPAPRPGPRAPRPGPRPPARRSTAPAAPADAPARPAPSDGRTWGRVADDGTVFVRTADGERSVGQMPDAGPEEALAFFSRRYDDLDFEVALLEQRVRAGALSPDEATASIKQVAATVHEAQAVGDLAGLEARLEALTAAVREQRAQRQQERTRKLDEAKAEKERIATEAEKLSQGSDWRNGANRMRALLDEWKTLPRLEKSVDDALWRTFSTARTTYTRRRKSHFSEVNEQREGARSVKEDLVVEAEALAASTEWGPTSGKYRDLMRRWKDAGPAPKGVDDALWKRFRAAQDAFFGARDAANAAQDSEFSANAEKKEALLVEAEKLVPVTDLRAAKEAFRDIADRWDEAGKVPRERMKDLEGRIRKVEQAIRGVEDDQWKRSNPEAAARAADTVAQLEASIADLDAKRAKAEAAGNAKKAQEHAAAADARREWLVQARNALSDFS